MSDHELLRWVNSIKELGQRLNRRRLKLRDYEYEFKYKPGKLDTNVDALSRISIIEKHNFVEEINKEYVRIAIHNLRLALQRENILEFSISRYGDFSDKLPKRKLCELLIQEFLTPI